MTQPSEPPGGHVVAYDGVRPDIADDAFVAPTAAVIGRVRIAEGASVWYSAVLRGDRDAIELGPGSNIQDCVVVHTDTGFPTRIGRGVSVGHNATVHGCTVEDDVLVGMGATVLNGARIGQGSLIAGGAVVLEGTEIPAGSLVAGVPAKVRRQLTDAERAKIVENARTYTSLARQYRAAAG